ncbi:MAG: IS110 family transposase [Burkholderiales bacterium]
MEKITTVGIDLAKQVFALHGVDGAGRVVLRKTLRRAQLGETVAGLPPCLIGMEACSGSHEWARRFQQFGHEVRLMAPVFVAPYRKSGKNDGNDAEAICEAVGRPNMRFVPVKSAEQQAVLSLHRVRQGWIEERTATINRLRAVLTEFGVVLPNRAQHVRRGACAAAEALPELARHAVQDLRAHLATLDERILTYDRELEHQARQSEAAQRLMQIRGVGPITAVAIVATVGNARDFRSGRQFAAWLGLTPRQHSSGGKPRLGHISRRGDAYLRCLLVQGARSVLLTAMRHSDRMSRWVLSVQARRGYHKALVAIAAKNARIAWALLSKNQTLQAA